MLRFKDFVPEQRDPPGFFARADYELFESTVNRASAWIEASHIEPIHVETVVLPNIHEAAETGSTDPDLRSSGEMSTYWHQIVRVWYRHPS